MSRLAVITGAGGAFRPALRVIRASRVAAG